jgi:tetratricopeptide (TPR) repeat protein
VPDVLRLQVRDFTDLTRWRWTLTDSSRAFLADHEVRLDPHAEHFEAFTDLRHYVSWHAAPDRYLADEARIVTSLGDWIGTEIFGDAIGSTLIDRHPATVEVILPEGAEALAYLPLEAARVRGRSLAGHDITLVMQPGTASTPAKAPVGDRLRVLGLFSLPEGGNPLNLRRERRALVQLIERIAANGRAADVRVLQYGVTRDRLRDVLEEAEGWDIIHVSGHGTPGELIFETPAGAPDRITASELADLLDTTRERLKLVTLSACWSAALSAAAQRRLLNLPVPDSQPRYAERPGASPPDTPSAPGALATRLASRLGCAVLAMRFPVNDEFAIAMSAKLYDLLARQGQPLPRATTLTLKHLTGGGTDGRRFPALSMTAPAIFGATATALTLAAPKRSGIPSFRPENLKLAGFPPQPDRFVGRTAVMTRASTALAAESGIPGVVLHGMPGGGKTACALEIAYTHEDAFEALIWFKAPDEGTAIDGALTDFALTLERSIDGLPMIDKLADDAKLDAFLPTLTELMERTRLLIIIDNAESLLTDTGQWRDERWGAVIGALTAHTGLGRVILTTRRVPEGIYDLRVESVDALTADEALLLIRELPHLHELIHGQLSGVDRDTARTLTLGILNVTQGHPKLLELANGQAADPERLTALIQAGDHSWEDQGGLPEGFFITGEASARPSDYLQILAAWTKSVADTLSPSQRDLFRFLCCLEEPDREQPLVASIWPQLWKELGREGQPPNLERTSTALCAFGLVNILEPSDRDGPHKIHIHPYLAAAERNQAHLEFQSAVDDEVSAFWSAMHMIAAGRENAGTVDTSSQVQAGLAAVSYLLRQEKWDAAAYLLDQAFLLNPSRADAAAMLPAIRRITDHDPRHADTLALILQILDPAGAEAHLRLYLDAAVARSDHEASSATAARLVNLLLSSGRLAEALSLTNKVADYSKQAGAGPWTQLADQVQRLQVLNAMGYAEQVLHEFRQLRGRMAALPKFDDTVGLTPWNVSESLLDTGRYAAQQLGHWEEALNLNAEIIASERARRAPTAETARTEYNDHGPLLMLGRIDDAMSQLLHCRQVFYDAGDIQTLSKTLTALASIENKRGHGDAALRLELDALRYSCLASDATHIPVSYHNLGNYLRDHARKPAEALATHLAAALIFTLTRIGDATPGSAVRSAAADLREFGSAAEPPCDLSDLCHRLCHFEGTSLPGLVEKLSPNQRVAEQTLQDLITQAKQQAETPAGIQDED